LGFSVKYSHVPLYLGITFLEVVDQVNLKASGKWKNAGEKQTLVLSEQSSGVWLFWDGSRSVSFGGANLLSLLY